VEPNRAQRASARISGLAFITAVLLGIAIIPQPNLADAADGKGGDATALSVMRGPGSDLPAGGSVVLRGTRPSQPSPGEAGEGNAATNSAFQQGPSNPYQQRQNNTFQQGPLYGSGWDTRYDYRGLNGTYFPVPQ
jgi:hypothetical protein